MRLISTVSWRAVFCAGLVWVAFGSAMSVNGQGNDIIDHFFNPRGDKLKVPGMPSAKKIQEPDVLVACVGDASTFGTGLVNRDDMSYPDQLDKMMGAGWKVLNFGRDGATLQSGGDLPFIGTATFDSMVASAPDVVLIALGREDTKPWNWQGEEVFKEQYRELVAKLQGLASAPMVMACLPPATPKQSGAVSRDGMVKCLEPIREVAAELDLPLIDFYTPLSGRRDVFMDSGNPDKKGAKEVAELAEAPLRVVEEELKRAKKDAL